MAEAGGTSLGQAHGTITIEAQLNQAAAQINQFSSQSEKEFAKIDQATRRTEQTIRGLAGALGINLGWQTLVQVGQAIDQLAQASAKNQVIRQSFDELAAGIGENADNMLSSMQDVSGGLISDADLILNANRSIVTGAADTSGEISSLLEIARGRAQALGISTSEAFERLTLGIGKREKELLDELGIVLNLNDVYDDYARRLGTTADALSEAEKSQAFFNAVLQDSGKFIGQNSDETEDAAEKMTQYRVAVDNLNQSLGDLFVEGQANSSDFWTTMIEGLTGYINAFNQIASGQEGGWGNPFGGGGAGAKVPSWMTSVPASSSAPLRSVESADREKARLKVTEEWADNVIELERNTANERMDAIRDYGKRRADMEADFEKNLTRVASDYAKQRARAVEEYEKGVARFQRDAQAQQLRMAEDHERNLARMREDHARRLGDLQEDLDTRIGDRRAESAERLADFAEDRDEGIVDARAKSADRLLEIEEEYGRSRTRAIRQHQDTLAEAAANLDAKAVWAEERRFARENADAEEAHQEKVDDEQKKLDEAIKNLNDAYAEKVDDEKEALQKSIDQAQSAYNKQVADANAALAQREQDAIDSYTQQATDFQTQHNQRLADMATDFTEEMTQRDGDQIERINEMKTDHQENLTELDTEHGERLLQISRHAGEERTKLDEEFEKEMGGLGDHNFDLENEQYKHQQRALKMYQDYLDDREREEINAQIRSLKRQRDTGDLTPAEVSALNTTIGTLLIALGRIGVEPGRHVDPRTAPVQIAPGEQVVTTSSLVAAAGSSTILPAAAGTGGATSILSIGDVSASIVLGDIGNRSNPEVEEMVGRAMLNWVQKAARSV